MRFLAALLVVCACGRFNFEGAADAVPEVLTITAPGENAEVGGTANLTGTCVTGQPIDLAGTGLLAGATSCEAGAFAAAISFTDGDGTKLVTVSQGTVTITRTFVRVTRVTLRSVSSGIQGSAGFTIDCDLTIARPADFTAGDLLFGTIYSDGGLTASITTPGFTRTAVAGGTYVAFWKLATPGEPVAYTFHIVAGAGPGDTCESAGVLAAFSGVDPATPILDEAGGPDSNDMIVIAPEVTAPKPAILVGAWGSNGPASGFTLAAMTVANQARSAADNANALLAYEPIAAGATGPRMATLTATRAAAAGLFVINGKP